jgi:hypothetical protein
MKSSAKIAVKGKVHEVRHKSDEKLGDLINDPTLEGKDESKVGRFQRKTRPADNDIKK